MPTTRVPARAHRGREPRGAHVVVAVGVVAAGLATAGARYARAQDTRPNGRVSPAPATADTVRHVVLLGGRVAGVQRSWVAPDGARVFAYTYNDRGRGPALTERVVLGPGGGTPTEVAVDGSDYVRRPVRERFARTGTTAAWVAGAESGRASASHAARAFYVSANGTPGETALLARALLASPAGRLPLLPSGEASIVRVARLDVAVAGRTRQVTAFALSGLALAPRLVWLDDRGALFAEGGATFMVIQEGWEPAASSLVGAQQSGVARSSAEMARTLGRTPHGGVLVLRDAALFDAHAGRSRLHMTVVVRGDRIEAVGPVRDVSVPPGAEVVDARGRTVLPGLWDMHVHMQADDGLTFLALGITSVRDLGGGAPEFIPALRHRVEAGEAIGPRIVSAGMLDGPGPNAGPTPVIVRDESSARAAVARFDSLGDVQIKVYSSVPPELVTAIADEAHRRGLRVGGHVPAFMTAEQAVRAGFDELHHANYLFLNFLADPTLDTRGLERVTLPAREGATLDLDGPAVQRFVALLGKHGTTVDPTLSLFERLFTAREGTPAAAFAAFAPRVPEAVRRDWSSGGLPVPDGMGARYRASFAAMLRLVRRLYDADVPLVIGTDQPRGFALARDLELFVRAGIPPGQVLRLATLGAATRMRLDASLGSLDAGKLADLVVVDGDPVARIADVRRVVLVVKGGRLYDPAALLRAGGVRPGNGPD